MSLGASSPDLTNSYELFPKDWNELSIGTDDVYVDEWYVDEKEYIDEKDYISNEYMDEVTKELETYDPYDQRPIEEEEEEESYIEEPYIEESYEEDTVNTVHSEEIILEDKVLNFEALREEEHSKTMTSLTMVKYNNKSRYVKYYYRDYILTKNDGIIDISIRRYVKLVTNKDTIANRKNNPGNITCSSGKRRLAYSILRRNVSDKGDAKSCIYASKELGMQDYKNLLSSYRYNNAPIKIAFRKYQSSTKSFKSKLRALVKAGVNINRTYNSLSNKKKEVFAKIYARYEGWKTTDSSITIELGVDHLSLENDKYELNSYLLDDKYRQVVTKIITERETPLCSILLEKN